MKKIINISLIFFLVFTTFLIVIHLETIEYYVDSVTNETQFEYHDKDFEINSYLNYDSNDIMRVDLSFNHIKSDFNIIELKVFLDSFKLIEIKPYYGMKNWDNPTYLNFSSIPDSLKFLTPQSNPYYAFDHFFKAQANLDKYNLSLDALIHRKGIIKEIKQKIKIRKIKKIELRPWDMHSDFTFLLIYLFGLLCLFLLLIKIIMVIIKKIFKSGDS